LAVVRLLLDRDDVAAQPNNCFGQTPLFWASGNGHKAVVELLLEQPAVCADAKDCAGQTPLFRAAEKGHAAVVAMLLDQDGVSANSPDCIGHTPLMMAAGNGHEPVVKLLLDRKDVAFDAKDRSNRTALLWAAASGHEAVVRLLLDRKRAALDSGEGPGRAPSSCAAADDEQESVALRLLHGRKSTEAAKRHRGGRPLQLSPPADGDRALVREFFATADTHKWAKKGFERTPHMPAAKFDIGTMPGQSAHFASAEAACHDPKLGLENHDGSTWNDDHHGAPGVEAAGIKATEDGYRPDEDDTCPDVRVPSHDATLKGATPAPHHNQPVLRGSSMGDKGSRRKRANSNVGELTSADQPAVDAAPQNVSIASERPTKIRKTRGNNGSDEYCCSSTAG
jgi:ankyrin repeat protein